MKKQRLCNILALLCLLLSTQCSDNEIVKYDYATLKGNIKADFSAEMRPKSLSLAFWNPILGEAIFQDIPLNDNGDFSWTGSIANTIVSRLSVVGYSYEFSIPLKAGEETAIEIDITDGRKNTILETSSGWKGKDVIASVDITKQIFLDQSYKDFFKSKPKGITDDMSLKDRSEAVIRHVDKLLALINSDTTLSQSARNLLVDDTRLFFLSYSLLSYPAEKGLEVDKSYFQFLEKFNLNNPQYLSTSLYSIVLRAILHNDLFDISPIGDQPIEQWLDKAKVELKDILGFENGLFYDLLASNSYSMQFEEGKSLTDKQKDNIKSYFSDSAIAKILLAKDKEVIAMLDNLQTLGNEENEGKDSAAKEFLDSIITENPDKIIFVDFWATWCGPCMRAMNEMKLIKEDLRKRGVVFVYVTSSSPIDKWEEKKKEIGGKHFFIESDKWNYLMDMFGFTEIPSYVIFDKKGNFKSKFTGYPGNEEMKKIIDSLL